MKLEVPCTHPHTHRCTHARKYACARARTNTQTIAVPISWTEMLQLRLNLPSYTHPPPKRSFCHWHHRQQHTAPFCMCVCVCLDKCETYFFSFPHVYYTIIKMFLVFLVCLSLLQSIRHITVIFFAEEIKCECLNYSQHSFWRSWRQL